MSSTPPGNARDSGTEGRIQLVEDTADDQSGVEGPYLGMFPGMAPPDDMKFRIFTRSREPQSTKRASQRIVVGETDVMEWTSNNYDEDVVDYYADYLVGIEDPDEGTVTFKAVPVFDFKLQAKRLKYQHRDEMEVATKTFEEQRDQLDMEFGSRKAQKRVLMKRMNEVNPEDLEEMVTEYLPQLITENASRPAKEKVDQDVMNTGIRPPYDPAAQSPDGVYKLQHIVADEELDAIDVGPYLVAKSSDERVELLPFKSEYVKERLEPAVRAKDRRRMKISIYITLLMKFRALGEEKKIGRRREVAEAMGNPPDVIMKNLYMRFTETPPGAGPKFSDKASRKLSHYLCALCLIIDNFAVEIAMLAKDLQVVPLKLYTVFKNLGCRIEALGKEERTRREISFDDAKKVKRAVLTTPLKLPTPKLGGRSKRKSR